MLGEGMARTYPSSNGGWGVAVDRYSKTAVGEQLRTSLYMLLAAVGALLLISCVNLANILLMRGADRGQELAVRKALGAQSWRLLRQFLVESLLLAALGGALGIGLGAALMDLLKRLLPAFYLPPEVVVAIDWRTCLTITGLIVLVGLLAGIFPALAGIKAAPRDALVEQSRGHTRSARGVTLRKCFVIAEVALTFALLCGSVLLLRSFSSLQQQSVGFDPAHLITAWLPVNDPARMNGEQVTNYYRQVLQRVRAVLGVRSAALSSALPFDGTTMGTAFQITTQQRVDHAKRPVSFFKMISPGYFEALGMKLIRGRLLDGGDVASAPRSVLVNRAWVKEFLHDENPLGKRLLFEDVDLLHNKLGKDVPWEIVGVVGDEKIVDLSTAYPCIYVTDAQLPSGVMALLIRARGDAGEVIRRAEQAVWRIDRNQPFDRIRTVNEIRSESMGSDRLRTFLLFGFSAAALALAAIGIFGVVAYSIAQRTFEIGLRSALGATRADLLKLLLGSTLALIAAGLALGVAGAWLFTEYLGSILFAVKAHDPLSFAAAGLVLLTVALAAGTIPALRAVRMPAGTALRHR